MLSGKNAASFRAKNWVRDSYSLQWAYARLATIAGRWQVRRGHNLAALDTLLRAWRVATRVEFDASGEAATRGAIRRTCFRGDSLVPASENVLVEEFLQTREARQIRETFGRFPLHHRLRLRFPRENDDPERQGNLILLKRHRPETGEKGVALIKYGESFLWFAALYDLSAIASRYIIVLEPCWAGYQDWRFLLYLGCDLEVLVFAPYPADFDFIKGLNTNLVPVRLGAGDWVDPDTFRPGPKDGRSFDLVMVSSWNPAKRHELLFRTLAQLKQRGYPRLRVALVGYPSGGWTRREIETMMRRHGVEDQCVIFESIPHAQVAQIVADARAYLLLSRYEGANKALYESLFCDTPVIVYRDHRGVNPDHVPPEVGIRARDEELGDAIIRVLESPDDFSPRAWAVSHTGWPRATEHLGNVLADVARRGGGRWDQPIVPKKNAPNLKYAETGKYREFAEEYAGLERFLR